MTARRAALAALAAAGVAALSLILYLAVQRSHRPAAIRPGAPTEAAAGTPGRRIKVQLFYVSDDGTRLVAAEREVPYGDGAEQAREIIDAQVAPAAGPLVSAVPMGTALRTLFISDRGEAYVDLSREISAAHTGGTLNELLTVYTIVNAITANMPAVHAVQILIEGKEVQTLAGHVDLRHPLARNLSLVQ